MPPEHGLTQTLPVNQLVMPTDCFLIFWPTWTYDLEWTIVTIFRSSSFHEAFSNGCPLKDTVPILLSLLCSLFVNLGKIYGKMSWFISQDGRFADIWQSIYKLFSKTKNDVVPNLTYELDIAFPTVWHVRSAKTQISLRICADCLESSFSIYRHLDPCLLKLCEGRSDRVDA